ncbi:MAG: hypothetical protein JXA82_08880, partial [Sedimentisphaerales bacterium]|nr:hypothetical protein [Sedimentisphaerales bacterium]
LARGFAPLPEPPPAFPMRLSLTMFVNIQDMKYDEILALAIRKEYAAQQLYSKLAGAAKDPQTQKIFTLLAQEEAKHKLALEIEYDLTTF